MENVLTNFWLKCAVFGRAQVLNGALDGLLQHPDWEVWRHNVARASFRPGELEPFMERHKRYKTTRPGVGSEAGLIGTEQAPVVQNQEQQQEQ